MKKATNKIKIDELASLSYNTTLEFPEEPEEPGFMARDLADENGNLRVQRLNLSTEASFSQINSAQGLLINQSLTGEGRCGDTSRGLNGSVAITYRGEREVAAPSNLRYAANIVYRRHSSVRQHTVNAYRRGKLLPEKIGSLERF